MNSKIIIALVVVTIAACVTGSPAPQNVASAPAIPPVYPQYPGFDGVGLLPRPYRTRPRYNPITGRWKCESSEGCHSSEELYLLNAQLAAAAAAAGNPNQARPSPSLG